MHSLPSVIMRFAEQRDPGRHMCGSAVNRSRELESGDDGAYALLGRYTTRWCPTDREQAFHVMGQSPENGGFPASGRMGRTK